LHDRILKIIDGRDVDSLTPVKVGRDHKEVVELVNAVCEDKLLEYLDVNDVKVSSLSDVFLRKKVVESRETLLLLFWCGGQVQKADNTGYTALHWAAHYSNLENAQLIIDAKPDLDALDTLGFNALWYAENRLQNKIFFALLRAGSDCNIIFRNTRCSRNCRNRIMGLMSQVKDDENVIKPERV